MIKYKNKRLYVYLAIFRKLKKIIFVFLEFEITMLKFRVKV